MEGGVSTIEPTQQSEDQSRRYVVGATIEVSVWRGFAVEADFLYRHNGFSDTFNFVPGGLGESGGPTEPVVSGSDRTRLDVFELPVVGKYYFRSDAKLQPFVLTGYSFRKALINVDSSTTTANSSGLSTQTSSFSYWTPADVGATFGLGLRWRTGRISLKPEIRYTYWGANPSIGVSKQQADVLVGITF